MKKIQTETIKSLDVKQEALDDIYAHFDEFHKTTVWQEECRSWFKDGKVKNRIYLWPGSVSWSSPRRSSFIDTYTRQFIFWNPLKILALKTITFAIDIRIDLHILEMGTWKRILKVTITVWAHTWEAVIMNGQLIRGGIYLHYGNEGLIFINLNITFFNLVATSRNLVHDRAHDLDLYQTMPQIPLLSYLSHCLGHSTIARTQIYLSSLFQMIR